MKLLHVIVCLSGLCIVGVAHAADPIVVHLVVVGSDQSEQDHISSYLNRELRDLHDVVISSSQTNADYEIRVIAMIDQTSAHITVGHVISVVVLMPAVNPDILTALVKPEAVTGANAYLSSAVRCIDHRLYICPTDSLKKQCEEIIADLDSSAFEDTRKARQLIEDTTKAYSATNAPAAP